MKKRIIIAGLLVCFAAAPVLWYKGRPVYRQYKERRSLAQARRFVEKGDFRNASLSARQTLQSNPGNIDACKILAELAQRSHSPHLLDWRRRLVELTPTTENKLLLASAALRIQGPPYPLAEQTLDEMAVVADSVPAYHVIAAELALKRRDLSKAQAQFQRAAQLEPTNELHHLNLAVLRLQSKSLAEAAEARATLERLRSSPAVGTAALRWLVAANIQNREWAAAEAFSKELLANSQATLDDRLQRLGIMQITKDPEFGNYLATLQNHSRTNATEVYSIGSWMAGHDLARPALEWLSNCPAQIRTEQPAPLAFVDCYVLLKDWSGLQSFLQPLKWADLEFLRFALLSRTAAEQKETLAADARWRSAIREAGERLGPLMTLLGLAGTWGRDKAREDLLWQIAQRFPREHWAAQELGRLYQNSGNTRGLNKLSALIASYNSKDFQAQNNLATTCFLLKLNLPKAHEVAKEIYQQHGEQPVIASTYAFSIFLQGRTNEAVQILEKFNNEELENPPVALYYGFFLSAAGNTNRAAKYLEIAKLKEDSFLPEERALLVQASHSIQ